MDIDSQHLTVAQAAELAQVSRRTIWRWIKTEGLPKEQPTGRNGVIRIARADLDSFLARDSRDRLVARMRTVTQSSPPRPA